MTSFINWMWPSDPIELLWNDLRAAVPEVQPDTWKDIWFDQKGARSLISQRQQLNTEAGKFLFLAITSDVYGTEFVSSLTRIL